MVKSRANGPKNEDIAIVGIGCRYPGDVNDPEQFWEFQFLRKDGFCNVPPDRWNIERFNDPDPSLNGVSQPEQCAFLDSDQLFGIDRTFFGLTSQEAGTLDPQQRLLLRVSWEAFEDANILPSKLAGEQVGVYVGGFTVDNLALQLSPHNYRAINQSTSTGISLVMLSNRLSYFYDFKGPSLTIDTACSSSLVAFHYAVRDLQHGVTNFAVVGGVNAILSPFINITMSKGGYLSPDSRSKTFDVDANGYARGEGAGVVLLKPLTDAMKDGDKIYATVRGTGVNQDGRTAGISQPSKTAQIRLIEKIIQENDIPRENVVLVEAHGTGTAIGDPTEISALAAALGKMPSGQRRFISSVKGNIGHQEAGAGIAGVIRAALSLSKGFALPQANFTKLNPDLNLKGGSFAIFKTPQKLSETLKPNFVCINSFGYGGTNAHAILCDHKSDFFESSLDKEVLPTVPLIFSGRTPKSLVSNMENAKHFLKNKASENISDVAFSLAVGRERMEFKETIMCQTIDPIETTISSIEKKIEELEQLPSTQMSSSAYELPKLAFCFSGMGPQWFGMGRVLYKRYSLFKRAHDEACEAISDFSKSSLQKELAADEKSSKMSKNYIAQPANFVLQHSLVKLLQDFGIEPHVCIGHSVGEINAALTAETLSLSQAAELVFHRSRFQQKLAGHGRVLATGLDFATASEIMRVYDGELSIAAINSSVSIALSGSEKILQPIQKELEQANIFATFVRGEVAYHSHQMDSIKDQFLDSVNHIKPKFPKLTLYSTVTGNLIKDELQDANYWWRNLRNPVLFSYALDSLLSEKPTHIIQVGPNPVLANDLLTCVSHSNVEPRPSIIYTLRRDKDELCDMIELCNKLWKFGSEINWSNIFSGHKIHLPTYAWQNQHKYSETIESQNFRVAKKAHPLLGYQNIQNPKSWRNTLASDEFSFLQQHVVLGTPVFPGTAILEIFMAAAREECAGEQHGLGEVTFERMIPLRDGEDRQLMTTIADDLISIHSSVDGNDWVLHATARILKHARSIRSSSKQTDFIGKTDYPTKKFYKLLQENGLAYDNDFQTVLAIWKNKSDLRAKLALKETTWCGAGLITHPAIIDGGLQVLAFSLLSEGNASVPRKFGRVFFTDKKINLSDPVYVHGWIEEDRYGHLIFLDQNYQPVLAVEKIEIKKIKKEKDIITNDLFQTLWRKTDIFEPKKKKTKNDSVITPQPKKEYQSATTKNLLKTKRLDHVFYEQNSKDRLFIYDQTLINLIESDSLEVLNHLQNVLKDQQLKSFVIVTFGGMQVNDHDYVQPCISAIWGLIRVLRNEHRDKSLALLDLPLGLSNEQELKAILPKIPDEGDFAYRNGSLYHLSLTKWEKHSQFLDFSLPIRPSYTVKAELGGTDDRPDFTWITNVKPKIEDDKIEIKIEYASLNFKDYLKIRRALPDKSISNTYYKNSLGMEASGVVTKAGLLTDFRVNERVIIGHPDGTLVNKIVAKPKDMTVLRWGDLDLTSAELTTIPIAYVTSYYALVKLARVKSGESVLIHSATGAVGHAAISIASSCNARIIATAGSAKKRKYLRNLGVKHVFDSRSINFETDVMRVTKGNGVDVVLNFLPGELMEATLRLVRPFGRFVEIGKADIGNNKSMPLECFEHNMSYHAVDIDFMLLNDQQLYYSICEEMKPYFASGLFKPIPTQIYTQEKLSEALSLVGSGGHIGKVLVDFTNEDILAPPLRRQNDNLFCSEKIYLITGGTRGLGLETAVWMKTNGARYLALISRSGQISDKIIDLRDQLKAKGGNVYVFQCDISKRDLLNDVFDKLEGTGRHIGGVFHAATNLKDMPFSKITEETFHEGFDAKAIGGLNLHKIVIERAIDLDYFVAFTSVSGILGTPGQSTYAAANVFLDSLVSHRRREGFNANSICLGPIEGAGMVARDKNMQNKLKARGLSLTNLDTIFLHLEQLLISNISHACIFDVNWDLWFKQSQEKSQYDIASKFISMRGQKDEQITLKKMLTGCHSKQQETIVCNFLTSIIADSMNVDQVTISLTQQLSMIGVDSLSTVELQLNIERSLGFDNLKVPLNNKMSIKQLAKWLTKEEVIKNFKP